MGESLVSVIQWQPGGEGELHISALMSEIPTLPDNAILSPIVDLAALAARGGMTSAGLDPRHAQCRVHHASRSGKTLNWQLQFDGLSPVFVDAIEGALEFTIHAISPLLSATVTAPRSMLPLRGTQNIERVATPFQLIDDRQLFQGGFEIDIKTQGCDEQTLEQLEEQAFGSWFTAGSGGSFCDKGFTPDVVRFYLEDPQVSPNRLTIGLDDSVIPEPSAANSLINTLVWAHHHITPIAVVELYE